MEIDPRLVRQLLAGQFPQWEALELRPVDSGWDNTIYWLALPCSR